MSTSGQTPGKTYHVTAFMVDRPPTGLAKLRLRLGEVPDQVEQYLTELRHYEILLARLQSPATSKARRPAVQSGCRVRFDVVGDGPETSRVGRAPPVW